MINVCFKRARNTDKAGLFHPDYIIEYYDETKFPEGAFPPSQFWESLSEDIFKKELKNNKKLQADYEAETEELARLRENQLHLLSLRKQADEKQLLRDFEAFKRWRKNK